ncbi:MAG: cytochrome P460 family protein [Thiobacillus sp.]|nr:cytochrome P460 family protein [Thiobacillus sp.]
MSKILVAMAMVMGIAAIGSVQADPYASAGNAAGVKNDGELALPADYASWPVYLKNIQRPDLKQIRDIYINPQGQKSSRPFAYGTTMVMELHSVKTGSDGQPLLDAEGKLQKQGLSKIFVMGKGPGWGQAVAPELRTGEWAYASFDGSGKSLGKDASSCRGCHVPMKDTDFVARVPEYEANRLSGK